jgi:hypothetical protein
MCLLLCSSTFSGPQTISSVFSQNDTDPSKRRRKKLDVNYSSVSSGLSTCLSSSKNEENRLSSGRENVPANILPGFPTLSTFDQFSPVKDRQSIPVSVLAVTNAASSCNLPSIVNPSKLFQSNTSIPCSSINPGPFAIETSFSSQKAKRVSLNLSQNVYNSSFSSTVSSSAGDISSSNIVATVTPFTKSLKTPGTSDFIPFQSLQQTSSKQQQHSIAVPVAFPACSLLLDMELPDSLWCFTFNSIDAETLSSQTVEDIDLNMDPGVYCNAFYLQGIHQSHKELEKSLSPFPYYLNYHKSIQKMHRANLIDVVVSLTFSLSCAFLKAISFLSSFLFFNLLPFLL